MSRCKALVVRVFTVGHHQSHGSLEQQATLELFKGNICGLLQSAAESGQLNDHLLSLAAMGQ